MWQKVIGTVEWELHGDTIYIDDSDIHGSAIDDSDMDFSVVGMEDQWEVERW